MSYTWTNGEVITAEKLNQTGGIRVVALEGDGTNYTLDITPKEITSLIRKGIVSLIFAEGSGGWSVLQLIGMNTLGGDYVLATNTTHTFALAETEDTYFHGPVSTGPS